MESKEFQIPVPWGHVAVKTWGEESNMPVMMLHGGWDNLGTFDPLIPLLPPAFYYICIDFPSHGLSSHYPPYMFLPGFDNVVTLKLVVNYINRKKYVFMGHSLGGQIALLFAELYPECCTRVILIDSFHFVPLSVPFFKQYLRNAVQGIMTIGKNTHGETPSYSLQEATDKIRYNRMDDTHLTEELAHAITIRNVVKSKDKYKFTTDFRMKFHINFFADSDDFCEILEKYPLTCPLLIIYSSKLQYHSYIYVAQKNILKNYFLYKIEGGHDAHGNNPEIVAPIISKFLLKDFSKI